MAPGEAAGGEAAHIKVAGGEAAHIKVAGGEAAHGGAAKLGAAWSGSWQRSSLRADRRCGTVRTNASYETANPSFATGRAWRDAGLAAGVLGTSFLLDEPVRSFARKLQSPLPKHIAGLGHTYGDWQTTAPILAGGGLALGLALEGGRGARLASAAFLGVFAGSMSNTFINWTLGRSRPREELGSTRFDPFRSNASLGSGHAAYAFAIAAAVGEVTDGWWATPFYAAAAVTALARVHGDRHWLSDAVVGSLIGFLVSRHATRTAMRWFGTAKPPLDSPSPALRVSPLLAPSAAGVQLHF